MMSLPVLVAGDAGEASARGGDDYRHADVGPVVQQSSIQCMGVGAVNGVWYLRLAKG